MPYADLKSHRLYYEDHKPAMAVEARPPLVFLHGFTLDHRLWSAQAEFFKKWYRVLLVDSKGHGLSDAPETGYSRDDRVDDLIRFLDLLIIDRVHLVGASMGGSTAIGFALRCQERLASLTLVSTGAAGYDVGPKIAGIDQLARERGVEAARRKWIETSLLYYRKDRQLIRDLLEKMMLEHSGAIWTDPMRGRYRRADDLSRVNTITTRTKIFAGGRDRIFLPLSKRLHALMPNSELCVFESAGHMLSLEAPERFHRELKRFLEGTEQA